MRNIILLIGRVLIAYIFVFAGYNKAMHYDPTSHYLESLGLPGFFTALVILLELGGGLLLILGAYTRVIGAAFAVFCLATAFMVHFHPGDDGNMLHFMKNCAMAGGLLYVAVFGAGDFSLDRKLKLKWS